MNWKQLFTQSHLTTLFGLIAGIPGIVLGIFSPGTSLALSPAMTHWLLVIGGLGAVGLGVVAKAFNSHSTAEQVEASTKKANGG